MDYENVLLLQRHLKIFVQCIWKRWKLLTYQFKRFKIEMVKYSTSLALENEPLWIKNVLKSLLDWIDNEVTEIWQKKRKRKKRYRFQLSRDISRELGRLAKTVTWVHCSFLLDNRTQRRTICSSLITRNDNFTFWHCIGKGDEKWFLHVNRKWKDTMRGQCQH